MSTQLALDIPPAAPPPVCSLRVDEIGIALHGTPEGRMWWELLRKRMPGRFTTIAVRMPGDLVDVNCADRTHAQWLAVQLHARGVPKSSVTIVRPAAPAS